ncbi:acyl-CoA thioesterase [Alkalimarinus alittae]|uniref:Acyl-CoA thioesterase n=1 Tax=Alkalimarinus alittae TaxID=2961619 RepID=A0ABY6MY87_9ALTE|nr:acyl-CoA thioesterase [Alkalimarinus alittae]UZE94765.1 acyl-CoA thioesterase [Alkalimarinus alittae]
MSQQSTKPVSDSSIEGQVYKVFPNDLNAHGTAFGGMIMAKCDRLSLVVAERHSGYVCVTASVDSIHFMAPAKENDTLVFKVSINRAWSSSMEIGVRVEAENSYTGDSKHILSAYFTFVALDENNKPAKVPALTIESALQERRFQQAAVRREARLQTIEKLKNYEAIER